MSEMLEALKKAVEEIPEDGGFYCLLIRADTVRLISHNVRANVIYTALSEAAHEVLHCMMDLPSEERRAPRE